MGCSLSSRHDTATAPPIASCILVEDSSEISTGSREDDDTSFTKTGRIGLSKNASRRTLSTRIVQVESALVRQPSRTDVVPLVLSSFHRIRNIFSKAIASNHHHKIPNYAKSKPETAFLLETLQTHCLFEHIRHDDLLKLIGAFESVTIQVTANTPEEDTVVVRQGDVVDHTSAYFYVIYKGKCVITVDGEVQTYAGAGDSFGELALLYDCPRMATVAAFCDDHSDQQVSSSMSVSTMSEDTLVNQRGIVRLFRVDQFSFRKVLHDAAQANSTLKMNLISSVSFLDGLDEESKLKLAEAMTARPFHEKEYLIRRGSQNCSWFLIERGVVMAKNISYGANHRWNGTLSMKNNGMYRDTEMSQFDSFGQRSLLTGELPVADCVARSAGLAYTIDRETFQEVVGSMATALIRSNDLMKLKSIPVVAETTQLNSKMVSFLASQIAEEELVAGTVICQEGEPLERPPALYFLRSGRVEIQSSKMSCPENVLADGYLGDDQLYADTNPKTFVPTYTATVVEDCTCGILTLPKCRRILDTHQMGKPQDVREYDSLVVPGTRQVSLDDLELHRIIGTGTFGQVWLISRETSSSSRRTYALKIQSMYELCQSGQADLIVREKNIMSRFHSPFIAKLVSSFKDDRFVYMMLELLQGGELYNRIKCAPGRRLPEEDAKFYFACVSQGLSYMHRLGFVYRDLKPENVMIDDQGYAILVDLGFCKNIANVHKSYTLCGTPLYLAPEVR